MPYPAVERPGSRAPCRQSHASRIARLAEQLRAIKGGFLLSINDVPEVRDIFACFAIGEVRTTYTIRAGGADGRGELLIAPRD